jgi:copper chaperone CopZ
MGKKKKQKPSSNKIKDCTLYVDGMHCASCEVLIEKKLLK